MRGNRILAAALCLIALAHPAALARSPAAPVSDTGPMATLEGNTLPQAATAKDLGPVADTLRLDHIQLLLRRPASREAALERYIAGLTEPGSANFHRWLTAEQIGERYGPSQRDVATVTRWLTAHGLSINTVYPSRTTIDIGGTAGQIRAAFQTEIHNVEIGGVRHIANMSDPKVPAALASLVDGPVGLHDVFPQPAGHVQPAFTYNGCDIGALTPDCHLIAPPDLATIYNFNPVFAGGNVGKGQTIAVVESSNIYAAHDWVQFRKLFGLSQYSTGRLVQTHPAPPSGATNCDDPGTNDLVFEATLDMEYSSAAAPGATIEVASCASTKSSWGINIALQNLINAASPPPIISVSYIQCEAIAGVIGNKFNRNTFMQAAAEGISIFVSAGDEGSATCDYGGAFAGRGIAVNALASTPYGVAVGGTDFGDTFHKTVTTYWSDDNGPTYGSAQSYIPEITWNDSCASDLIAEFVTGKRQSFGMFGFCNRGEGKSKFINTRAGGGGPSSCSRQDAHGNCLGGYAKPYWQTVLGNPDDGVRDLPDVSLFSASMAWGHGYVVCLSDPSQDDGDPCSKFPGAFIHGYGTSFASPIMAGVQALLNTATGDRAGNVNPVYYRLARTAYGAAGAPGCNATRGNTVGKGCVFHDITEGNIDVPCIPGTPDCYAPSGAYGVLSTSPTAYKVAFPTGRGWDFATGIGSVDVANLVKNWPH